MKDPTRLIEADGTEFERLLLRTAASEVPSPELSARMLAGAASAGAAVALLSSLEFAPGGAASTSTLGASALGSSVQAAGTGAAVAGAGGSIAPPAAAGLLGSWLLKWGVLGALFSGAVVSGFLVVRGGEEASAPRAVEVQAPASPASVLRAPRAMAPDAEAASVAPAVVTDEAEVEATQAAGPVGSARMGAASKAGSPASGASSSLGQELTVLDAARRALAAGDAERALSLIAGYRKRFPHGALGQEATVLEVDALDAKGRAAQATDLKKQFLAEHPESAHRERVKRSGQTQ